MQALTRHAGLWAGTNRFRLMPDDPPAEADATAQLSLGAGGNVAVLAYTWTHPDDGAQDGLLVLGPDESAGGVVALWGDSWHQKPAAKQLRGATGHDTLTVGYAYAEGWERRITFTVPPMTSAVGPPRSRPDPTHDPLAPSCARSASTPRAVNSAKYAGWPLGGPCWLRQPAAVPVPSPP